MARSLIYILLLILPACAAPSTTAPDDWRDHEQRKLSRWIQQGHRDDDPVELAVSTVVQLDEQILLVGGSYRTPAASARSVMLRSDDGGKTWRDTGVWLTGSDTGQIVVLDRRHAWAVVNASVEGSLGPFVIFRTTDSGETWQRGRNELPQKHSGIPWDFSMHFASPKFGMCRIEGSTGVREHYITTDGGDTWRWVHTVEVDPDNEPEFHVEDNWKEHQIHLLRRRAVEKKSTAVSTLKTRYMMHEDGSVTPVGDELPDYNPNR